mgnify:CR=1 FL=1
MVFIAALITAIYLGIQIEDVGYRRLLNTYYWKKENKNG